MNTKPLKLISLFAILPLCGALNSCNKKMFSNIKQVVPYLHEIDYTDYVFDINEETIKKEDNQPISGCATVRKGNLYARNFDNARRTMPEFVVKMAKKGNRHASIGIANYYRLKEELLLENKYDNHVFEVLPTHMLDGINDCGVVCNANLIDATDIGAIDQKTGKERVNVSFLTRLVLDNCSTAKEGVDLIKSYDVFGSQSEPGFEEQIFTMQLMIADPNETYYVNFIPDAHSKEIITNAVKCKDNVYQEGSVCYDVEPIMTNFVKQPIGGNLYNRSIGVERYRKIKEQYSGVETDKDLLSLMHSISYAHFYMASFQDVSFPQDEDGYIYKVLNEDTCWFSEKMDQESIREYHDKLHDFTTAPNQAARKALYNYLIQTDVFIAMEEALNTTMPEFWYNIIMDDRSDDMNGVVTSHCSIYDIEKKTLRIAVDEDFNYIHTHTFSL